MRKQEPPEPMIEGAVWSAARMQVQSREIERER